MDAEKTHTHTHPLTRTGGDLGLQKSRGEDDKASNRAGLRHFSKLKLFVKSRSAKEFWYFSGVSIIICKFYSPLAKSTRYETLEVPVWVKLVAWVLGRVRREY